jgi:hypothetical protein
MAECPVKETWERNSIKQSQFEIETKIKTCERTWVKRLVDHGGDVVVQDFV